MLDSYVLIMFCLPLDWLSALKDLEGQEDNQGQEDMEAQEDNQGQEDMEDRVEQEDTLLLLKLLNMVWKCSFCQFKIKSYSFSSKKKCSYRHYFWLQKDYNVI